MAHLENYNKRDYAKVIKELLRDLKEYKNNVDLTKSDKNLFYGCYAAKTLGEAAGVITSKITQHLDIEDLSSVRRNTSVLSNWVVSLPKDKIFDNLENQRKFFDSLYEFCNERYPGKVVGGVVHMDETHPHMHISIVPLVDKDKRGNVRKTLSASSHFSKSELSQFHDDLDAFMFERFGKRKLVKNEKTKYDGVSLDTFKELEARKAELDERQLKMDQVSKFIKDEYEALRASQSDFKAEKDKWYSERDKNAQNAFEKAQIDGYNSGLHKVQDDYKKAIAFFERNDIPLSDLERYLESDKRYKLVFGRPTENGMKYSIMNSYQTKEFFRDAGSWVRKHPQETSIEKELREIGKEFDDFEL